MEIRIPNVLRHDGALLWGFDPAMKLLICKMQFWTTPTCLSGFFSLDRWMKLKPAFFLGQKTGNRVCQNVSFFP